MSKRKKNRLQGQAIHHNPFTGLAEHKIDEEQLFCLNFKNFHSTQGQTFAEWERELLLSKALERCKELCKLSMMKCQNDQTIKIYGNFPSNSKFSKPNHVPEDAQWASMRVQVEKE